MAKPTDFLNIVKERGFLHQCTDEEGLSQLLANSSKPVVAYCGFDCTARSLHVGSLTQIMLMRWWQKCGGRPIVLMGGGTTKVGDPSGKDEARKILSDEEIEQNMHGIADVFGNYLTFGEGPTDAMMVNNDEWLRDLKYIDFLRDYGRHFSINRMLSMDSVKLRLEREQELSFLEFNYMILQAYDFVKLHEQYQCRLQFGGSDQWGNIVMGVELHRNTALDESSKKMIKKLVTSSLESETIDRQAVRSLVGKTLFNEYSQVFGFTTPLLTTASGAKMGKTAAGAVWLNGEMTSPYDFWQYWRNTEDADVGRFLCLFTDLPMEEIKKLKALKGSEINEAKKILAYEVTKLCHGAKTAQQAAETARKTFEEGAAAEGLPEIALSRMELDSGVPVVELFQRAGLAASKSEARRKIEEGAVRVNDAAVYDANLKIHADALQNGIIKLSMGKKRHARVRLAS